MTINWIAVMYAATFCALLATVGGGIYLVQLGRPLTKAAGFVIVAATFSLAIGIATGIGT
jgi:hypothetical protein